MRLSKNQLQAVEKGLFEVARKQKSSAGPVELPLPDFWASVAQLTASLEAELSETVQSEGMTAKAQLQTRRLGNVRTLVTDLTRIRLNAFTQHAVLVNLMKGGGAEAAAALQHLSVIDWERHDPTERAYYQSLGHLVDKYKHDVAWKELVNGSNGGSNATSPPVPSPDASLTEYTELLQSQNLNPRLLYLWLDLTKLGMTQNLMKKIGFEQWMNFLTEQQVLTHIRRKKSAYQRPLVGI